MQTEIQGGRRSLEVLQGAVVRPAMILLIAGVLWGTLIAFGFAWRTVSDGLSAAIGATLPHGSGWGWLNLLTALLAVIVWLFAAATVLGGPARERTR